MDLKLSLDHLDLRFSQLEKITKAELSITDLSTKETENITFNREGGLLAASIPTVPANRTWHWDVLALIAIFGITMWLSQKLMMSMNNKGVAANADPTQQAIQKSMGTFMPIMIMATFIMIPIPAGVFIYLIVSNIVQVIQTVVVGKQIEKEEAMKKAAVSDIDLANAKNVTKE